MECRIFVYGTLKRNQKYHQYLKGSEYLGTAALSGPYRMYLGREGDFPMVIRVAGECRKIFGEVFCVRNYHLLRALDRFEDVPDLYRRATVLVRLGGRFQYPQYMNCFIYLANTGPWGPGTGALIASGRYDEKS